MSHPPYQFDTSAPRLEQTFQDGKPRFTPTEARAEALRCLFCHDAPCVRACPTEIDIPLFIRKIGTSNPMGAAATIFESNVLGYSCARVCPVEVLCVGACVINQQEDPPIAIGRLQRYATEHALDHGMKLPVGTPPSSPKRVACVGAGPASLACAAELRRHGHDVTMFESRTMPGGLNTTGIAPYKIKTEEALREVDWVLASGTALRTGVSVGEDLPVDDLLRDFDAVFLGMGLGSDSRLGISGEDAQGVWGATALIENIKNRPGFELGQVRRAVVIGGGNTALDVARELVGLSVREVTLAYRRTSSEMPGYAHELEAARAEGVVLVEEVVPVRFETKDGRVSGVIVADAKGGAAVSGTERAIPADLVAVATGQEKRRALAAAFGAQVDSKGRIVVDPVTRRTSVPRVYAGGDCVNGGKEVVNAVADGRDAARAMLQTFGC